MDLLKYEFTGDVDSPQAEVNCTGSDVTITGFAGGFSASGNPGACRTGNTHIGINPSTPPITYYSWTITASTLINVSNVYFDTWTDDVSIGAMKWRLDHNVNGGGFSTLDSGTFSSSWSTKSVSTSVSLDNGETIEYRLYVYGASAGYYNARLDNITVSGTEDTSSSSSFFKSSSSSILLSSESSESSQSSETSSAYGYLAAPTSFQMSSVNPVTRKVNLAWTWANPPAATPQEPTGFRIYRRVGDGNWEFASWRVAGDATSYEDTLPLSVAESVFAYGESLSYRIQAYWVDLS